MDRTMKAEEGKSDGSGKIEETESNMSLARIRCYEGLTIHRTFSLPPAHDYALHPVVRRSKEYVYQKIPDYTMRLCSARVIGRFSRSFAFRWLP